MTMTNPGGDSNEDTDDEESCGTVYYTNDEKSVGTSGVDTDEETRPFEETSFYLKTKEEYYKAANNKVKAKKKEESVTSKTNNDG